MLYFNDCCQKFLNGLKTLQYRITSRDLFQMRFSAVSFHWVRVIGLFSCDRKFLFSNFWLHYSTESRDPWSFCVNAVFSEQHYCSKLILFIPVCYRQSFISMDFIFLFQSVLWILQRLAMETLFHSCGGLTLASSQAPTHLVFHLLFSAEHGEKIW